MPSFVVAVVVGVALITAVLGTAVSLRSRDVGRVTVAAATLTALAVLVQSVIAVAGLIGGHRPTEMATTVGYLIGIAVVMPLGIAWALAERGRYSGYVIAVAAVTVAVMTARILQLWKVTA